MPAAAGVRGCDAVQGGALHEGDHQKREVLLTTLCENSNALSYARNVKANLTCITKHAEVPARQTNVSRPVALEPSGDVLGPR